MKRTHHFFLFLICFLISSLAFANNRYEKLTENFIEGDPDIQSVSAIAFAPEGILLIGDTQNATVIALDTEDREPAERSEAINIKNVDEKIAAALGTTEDAITIQDMAINQLSKMVYFAIHLQDATPVILKTDGEHWNLVELSNIKYSKVSINSVAAADAKDRRGRSLRRWAISDLGYYDGKVMITGLSNEEFSSTFRSIFFPFQKDQMHASLEIYHAAHGKYETYAPIKTFMPYELNGKKQLIASFTCTPMVLFPMDELKTGKHTKGRTIAELGNWNTPMDILSFQKGEKEYIYMANTNRALMRFDPEKIEAYAGQLTERVERYGTAGVEFLALPFVNVLQMDKMGDELVLLQRKSNGDLNLFAAPKRQL